MRSTLLSICTLLAGATPLLAQFQGQVPTINSPNISAQDRLRVSARLPVRTAEIREAGVADSTIRRIFGIFRDRNLDALQVDQILIAERDAARAHGPTDNFGAFVQRQLDAGKRGRELSAAIQAEHRARGHRDWRDRAKKDKEKQHENGRDDRGRDNSPGQGQQGRDRRPN